MCATFRKIARMRTIKGVHMDALKGVYLDAFNFDILIYIDVNYFIMVVANHNTNDFKGEITMDILNPMGLEVRCKKINGEDYFSM